MKNQLIIALAISISALSFAQKKELKLADKAIKANKFADAKTALGQAESLMASMDSKLKNKYYYLNALALYSNGKADLKSMDAALESLAAIEGEYKQEITTLKQDISNALLKTGNKAYEANEFSKSSKYFEKAYRVAEKDTVFLYYAAATAVNVQEYDRALKLYEELKTLGYTGIAKQYFAVNKETNEEESFSSSELRDVSVKAQTHIKPTDKVTESKNPEIVKNIALIYVSQGNDEKALEAMKDARAASPDDINLILSEANVHHKMGNTEEFNNLLKRATELDPENAELRYNLGVIANESDHPDEAKMHYNKAIELDPNYINAYINLSALILSQEQPLIEEMNGLGTSRGDNARYDELREQRQNLYKEAIPYLTKAIEIDEDNINASKTLMNIYSILGETDKYKSMKEKVEALESAQ